MARKPKKRAHGTGSLIRRGNSWLLRILVNGKIIQRTIRDPYTGLRAHTKAEAERLASAMRVELFSNGKAGLYERDQTVSLGELNQAYLESYAERWTRKRKVNWLYAIEQAMRFFKTVDEITHERLGDFVQKRLATPTFRGDPRTPAAVNRELECLRRLLNWGVQTGRLPKNPMKGFSLLKTPFSRDRILSREELERLIQALDKPAFAHIRLIVLIAVTTGMRRGEIFSLKWAGPQTAKTDNMVNLDEGVFDLQRTKAGRRKVPIPSILKAELAALPRVSNYVFPSPVDTTKPISDIKKSFRALMQEARIEGCRFHDLRHVAASGWVEGGVDIKTVQELLGHTSIITTQRYLTSLAESKQKAVDGIAAKILGGAA
ncbi:MAG TPA: site-specific integrase [bacterium]|nr:site-specific integrase [bacterium]